MPAHRFPARGTQAAFALPLATNSCSHFDLTSRFHTWIWGAKSLGYAAFAMPSNLVLLCWVCAACDSCGAGSDVRSVNDSHVLVSNTRMKVGWLACLHGMSRSLSDNGSRSFRSWHLKAQSLNADVVHTNMNNFQQLPVCEEAVLFSNSSGKEHATT